MPNILYKELDFIKKKIEEKFMMEREKTNSKVKMILDFWEKENHMDETPPISERTLTRIWSDYSEEKNPGGYKDLNIKTIDSLVQLIEYESDWEEYKKIFRCPKNTILFDPESIVVSDLTIGEEVIIGWKPFYYFDLIYLGNSEFKVQGSHDINHVEKKISANAFLIDHGQYFMDIEGNIKGYTLPRIVCVHNVHDLGIIAKDGVYNVPMPDYDDDISYL